MYNITSTTTQPAREFHWWLVST